MQLASLILSEGRIAYSLYLSFLTVFSSCPQIANDSALSELTSPTSGVILTLTAHLRQCVLPSELSGPQMPVLDGTSGGRALQLGGRSLTSGPMMAILKGLVEAVLRCGGGLQRVRANLYTALLYFVQTAQKSEDLQEKGTHLFICLLCFRKLLRPKSECTTSVRPDVLTSLTCG